MSTRSYGLIAEFEHPERLSEAARRAYGAGFRALDAYAPYPVEDLAECIGMRHDWVATISLAGGVAGGATAFLMQWYSAAYDYPIISAGKPYFSWPAFIPVTFELTVLFSALSAAFGMLALNRLPKPYHPVFSAPGFERASKDRFYLCIRSLDPLYHPEQTRVFLENLAPLRVHDIPLEDPLDEEEAD